MEISSYYANGYANGNLYVNDALAINAQQASSSRSGGKSGGDSISISEEARRMLAAYGTGDSSTTAEKRIDTDTAGDAPAQRSAEVPAAPVETAAPGVDNAAGQDDSGTQGNASGASTAYNSKDVIEAQLSMLISQLSSMPVGDPRATAVNSRIAGLQAQLGSLNAGRA